jgi:hypothetical protein
MAVNNNVILNHNEINHKIRRIAFQIYEKYQILTPYFAKLLLIKNNRGKSY